MNNEPITPEVQSSYGADKVEITQADRHLAATLFVKDGAAMPFISGVLAGERDDDLVLRILARHRAETDDQQAEIERLRDGQASLLVPARDLARSIAPDDETQAIIEICEAVEKIDALNAKGEG